MAEAQEFLGSIAACSPDNETTQAGDSGEGGGEDEKDRARVCEGAIRPTMAAWV